MHVKVLGTAIDTPLRVVKVMDESEFIEEMDFRTMGESMLAADFAERDRCWDDGWVASG
jgi:hypothetical protein